MGNKFKSLSHAEEDYAEYALEAEALSKELNLPKQMSIAQYLKMAHDFYKQNRKKDRELQNDN